MNAPRSKYIYGFEGDVLWIEDVGGEGDRSVTNDTINVLNEIMVVSGIDLKDYRVVYKDSMGNWDGIIPHTESHGLVFETTFYPIQTTKKSIAIASAKYV